MREIKFRVWQKSLKRFMSQYYDGGERIVMSLEGKPLEWDEMKNLREMSDDFVVQQYTGLKDKNVKEIYEGDILTVYRTFEPYKKDTMGGENGGFNWYSKVEQGKVFWSVMTTGFMIEYSGDDDIESMGFWRHRFEVMGNIFEGVDK